MENQIVNKVVNKVESKAKGLLKFAGSKVGALFVSSLAFVLASAFVIPALQKIPYLSKYLTGSGAILTSLVTLAVGLCGLYFGRGISIVKFLATGVAMVGAVALVKMGVQTAYSTVMQKVSA